MVVRVKSTTRDGLVTLSHVGLHFSLESRGTNIDGSVPVYKNPKALIEDRVAGLLPWMTVQEKVAQIIQGDIMYYIANPNEPLDDTLAYNLTGLQMMNEQMSGSVWAGYLRVLLLSQSLQIPEMRPSTRSSIKSATVGPCTGI
uniref:Glycoside hydrolase family 3 protein n=1 Tax=Mycena chlorophos TaxID=658473 RepID=A0ABQ0LXA7_MYCCL|nr:glycoside hydrolase family 3 protein [Mycena chlorophos]